MAEANDADGHERLAVAVELPTEEVHILREIVDRLQDDLAWALNNDRFRTRPASSPMHITSMPANPLAPDFGEHINRYRPEDIPSEPVSMSMPTQNLPTHQGELF